MTIVEKNKKKKTVNTKREVEIPIFVMDKKSERGVALESKVESPIGELKIAKDEDDLPILENKNFPVVPEENFFVEEKKPSAQTVQKKDFLIKSSTVVRKKMDASPRVEQKAIPAVWKKKVKMVSPLDDPKRKETILFASVVLIASLIFFVWLVILRNNLSSGPETQNSFSLEKAGTIVNNFRSDWEKISSEWTNIESSLENQQKVEDLNKEVVDKLKDKILTGGTETEAVDTEVKAE